MIISVEEAIYRLNQGDVVAIPTETVYGLASRIDSELGLKKIFSTKERPFFDPLIIHVSSLEQAKGLVKWWPDVAELLAKCFWPGPLTMILPKETIVSSLITSGLETVALRMPRHSIALEIISKVGVPLAAPSANKFGRTSPTRSQHVEEEFLCNNIGVVEGGACEIGLESTVLLIRDTNPIEFSILRTGRILQSEIENALSKAGVQFKFTPADSKTESPGQMKHHYMPKVPFVLCKAIPRCDDHLKSAVEMGLQLLPKNDGEIYLIKPQKLEKFAELVLSADPALAAREFYQKLRDLSELQPDIIYFVAPSYLGTEAWGALLDRMTKAATLILDKELD